MKYMTFLTAVLLLCWSGASFGQETVEKRERTAHGAEHYYVLKENKEIKHGQYIRYGMDVVDREKIEEVGFFDNNERTGEWYHFYPDGSLKSNGMYQHDLKHGLHCEYYFPVKSTKEAWEGLLFNIPYGMKVDENGMLIVEKKEERLAAKGVYAADKKMGGWNYYGSDGKIIHKYDHTLDTLTYSTLSDSANIHCPYLGGKARFINQYGINSRILKLSRSMDPSKVVIEIDAKNTPVTIKRIRREGSNAFAKQVEEMVKNIPDEWIRSLAKKPIRLTVSFHKEHYAIELNE